MNFSLPVGLIGGLFLMTALTMSEMKNPSIMGNLHGILMVFGGTLCAALVCFPFSHFFNMFKVFFRALSGKQKKESIQIIADFKTFAEVQSNGQSLNPDDAKNKNSFRTKQYRFAKST